LRSHSPAHSEIWGARWDTGMALDADLLVKALLGGINRRLDRQK
jgi:hypothetical protein